MSSDQLIPVPPGHIASVVTHLEWRGAMAEAAHEPDGPPLKLERRTPVDLDQYRRLYRAVGGPWLWFSRLVMDQAKLAAILSDPQVRFFTVEDATGSAAGMLELDFREADACEIAFLGLVPGLSGRGHGGWLIRRAIDMAQGHGAQRIWLHTCTLDDPRALGFYMRHGFDPVRRELEIYPDPRLTGHLPRDTAPHVPLI